MNVILAIPDGLAASLSPAEEKLGQVVLEGFAVQAYRSGALSLSEVRELLGHASRWETEDFLAQQDAWPDPTESEIESDMNRLHALPMP